MNMTDTNETVYDPGSKKLNFSHKIQFKRT